MAQTSKNPSIISLEQGSWYRGFIQGKTRIVIAWIFAAALVFSARVYPQWPGIVICLLGATLRFWASGFLRKDSRPAVGGPYALCRNPLYLGTWLMAVGTAAAIQAWILLVAMSVIFIAIYHYIILDEETKLARIFGEPYNLYKTLVPRFFPRLWPQSSKKLLAVNPEESHHHFSYELAMKNKAFEPFWSFAGLIGLVALVAYCWQRFGA